MENITCEQRYDWSSEESAREIQSEQKVPDLFKQEYPGRGAVQPNYILPVADQGIFPGVAPTP